MYRFALARVDAQAESIASLKGASAEHKHIRDAYAVHRFDVGYHHYMWAKFQVVDVGSQGVLEAELAEDLGRVAEAGGGGEDRGGEGAREAVDGRLK